MRWQAEGVENRYTLAPVYCGKLRRKHWSQECAGMRIDCLKGKGHRAFHLVEVGFAGEIEPNQG